MSLSLMICCKWFRFIANWTGISEMGLLTMEFYYYGGFFPECVTMKYHFCNFSNSQFMCFSKVEKNPLLRSKTSQKMQHFYRHQKKSILFSTFNAFNQIHRHFLGQTICYMQNEKKKSLNFSFSIKHFRTIYIKN